MALKPAPSIVIRPAHDGDFDPWLALYEAVAAERLWMGAEAPLDPVNRRQVFDRCLTDDDAALLLAEEDGRLMGAVNLMTARGVVDLGMFVARDARGGGIGAALVEAALGWARESGAHKVSLAVWPHNHAARGLYSKYGFVTEGTRRRHYRRRNGELWDAVLMGLILDHSTSGGPRADRHPPPAPVPFPEDGIAAGGLVLRPWRAADGPAVVEAVADPEIGRWLDLIPRPYTAADAAEFVAGTRRDLTEARGVALAVTDPGGGVLGSVGLSLVGANPGLGQIGYWVAAGARGRGVATRAARALTDWGFGHLGLRRVEVCAAVDNTASRTVAERAGFELEGIRRAWRSVHGVPTDFAAYARLAAPA